MKLDKIKFAKVVACIVEASRNGFDDEATIESLDQLIDIPQEPYRADTTAVDELLRQIANPDGFIPAVKAYRTLTGAGLNEAKEAVERYRVIPKYRDKVEEPATLGDILGKAKGI